jgi:PhzF family phenazine biosynthesis protein
METVAYIIDTFTAAPFKGNPTGVCYSHERMDNETMLSLANELGFPVSAFLNKANGSNEYKIRYFTPTTEIPACGHATLAAAQVVLLEDKITNPTFHTSNKIIIKTLQDDGLIMMSYPKYDLQDYTVSAEMLDSLGLTTHKSAGYCPQLEAVFIELNNASALKAVKPDYKKLVASSHQVKEVVITSASDSELHDYVLRSFCPWIGIDEDPVTGSVHSVLAGFWKTRLRKDVFNVFQASERGGELVVKAFDDKVEIGGRTVTLFKGTLQV